MCPQGVEGIRKVFIREAKRPRVDADSGRGYFTENEWMLDTEGVNLLSVMCHPEVDYTRTVSNHLIEIIDVLGIEAARNALMKVHLDGIKMPLSICQCLLASAGVCMEPAGIGLPSGCGHD